MWEIKGIVTWDVKFFLSVICLRKFFFLCLCVCFRDLVYEIVYLGYWSGCRAASFYAVYGSSRMHRNEQVA